MAKINKNIPYRRQYDEKLEEKLFQKLDELPRFASDFFAYMADDVESAVSTRLSYATDLGIFFEFLHDYKPEYADIPIRDLPAQCLESMTMSDIRYYVRTYLSKYESADGTVRTNTKNSRAHKLAVLRKFYHYYLTTDNIVNLITNDPVSAVVLKVSKDKPIKYLEPHQSAQLLDDIEGSRGASANKASTRQEKWNEKTSKRDLAICTLILGTGIRVSECVGINISDIDFEDGSIRIIRKGNKADRVYMSNEVEDALRDYLFNDPGRYEPDDDNKNALFISRDHTRMTARSIERMVKKYTTAVTGTDDITVHKLRSTFATNLLADESNNVGLKEIQDALGHSSPATSSKYYVQQKEETKRRTYRSVKLRET